MYHCNEILYYAYESADVFVTALVGWPFNGGLIKSIDLDALNWIPEKNTLRVTTDRMRSLSAARFTDHLFTHKAKVRIGYFPNGNSNYVTLYYSQRTA